MANGPEQPGVFLLSSSDVSEADVLAATTGAAFAVADTALIEVAGSGAVACIQGLITNDIQGAGERGVIYGAVLTPNGMIVTDLWAARTDGRVWITTARQSLEALLAVFAKYLPPRLATVTDRTDTYVTLRVVGPGVIDAAHAAGLDVPEPGQLSRVLAGGAEGMIARPALAPFTLQIQVVPAGHAELARTLVEHGMSATTPGALEAVRILDGWPRVGAEIDGKTLPQEVAFDDHAGISYTKGCYTGQETVARLHFRGHANRALAGLVWTDVPDPGNPVVEQLGASVGRVTSIAQLPGFEAPVGLAMLHRKCDRTQAVLAAGRPANPVSLPLRFDP